MPASRPRRLFALSIAAAATAGLSISTSTASYAAGPAAKPTTSTVSSRTKGSTTTFTPTVKNPTTATAAELAAAGKGSRSVTVSPNSVVGGTISRTEVLARAQSWVDQQVPYSETATHTDANGTYRTDCSGFVSMAWNLPDGSYNNWGATTDTLRSVATQLGSLDDLQPGDMIDNITTHVVLFTGWTDASHTVATIMEEPHTGLTAEATTYTRSGLVSGGFLPFRYNNITSAPPSNVQLDIVGADGALYNQAGNSAGQFNPVWSNEGGASLTKVTSVDIGGNLVHYFAVAGGRVYTEDHIPSTNQWTGWQQVPGNASGVKDISAAPTGNNVIVSIVGGDGVLYTQYANYDASHFDASWTQRDGASLTSISTVSASDNLIHMYAVGAGGRVYGQDFTVNTNSLSPWAEIPGNATGVNDLTAVMAN